MTWRNRMTAQFSLYSRAVSIQQLVQDFNANKISFYVVLQDGTEFAATTLARMKVRLTAFVDDFGATALTMTLQDVPGLWEPQAAHSPDGDESAMNQASEVTPVVENGKLIGVVARTRRGLGSSNLETLYGPRFALFDDVKPDSAKQPPTRTCPNCSKTIDYYKPRRVGDNFERHCPHCDFLIPVAI